MSAQPQPRLTPEQYLEIERAAEFKSDYYNGRMYAMAGGTHMHALIIFNLGRRLGNALEKRRCLVTASDVRMRVAPGGLYTYPDLVVVCGEPSYLDNRRDTLLNPRLIVEVLSPSTEAYDRGFKSAQYRALESFEEYALVSQTEPRVEVFRRQPGGQWLLSEFAGLHALCRFESVDAAVALSEVYDNVAFGEGETVSGPSTGG
jgi:Uma2 family endonuclease